MLPRKIKVLATVCCVVWIGLMIYIAKIHFLSHSDTVNVKHVESHWLGNDPFYRQITNVCMSSDVDRIIGLVAAVNSIYKNTKYPVKFYLLVTQDAYQPLSDWLSKTELRTVQREIKIFDVETLSSKIKVHAGRQDLAKPMNYARFYYTEYFPELKGRAIHIDDDTVIQGDVAELIRVSLTDNKTAAFANDCVSVSKRFVGNDRTYFKYVNFSNEHVKSLDLSPIECSFNTGVYVFDVDAWRTRNVTQQLEFWVSLNSREPVYGNVNGGGGSQPPLMLVFYQQYIVLNPLWNVRHLGLLSGPRNNVEIVSRAKLLHWSGPEKPWHGRALHTAVWDKYYIPDPSHIHRPVRKYSVDSV